MSRNIHIAVVNHALENPLMDELDAGTMFYDTRKLVFGYEGKLYKTLYKVYPDGKIDWFDPVDGEDSYVRCEEIPPS